MMHHLETDAYLIREGALQDLEALTSIYNHYIENSTITFDTETYTSETRRPWFEQFFKQSAAHRLRICAHRDTPEVPVAYACSQPFRPKKAYNLSVEISVYCKASHLGLGLGKLLYRDLLQELSSRNAVHRVYALITMPNDPSVALHKRFGFEQVGTLSEAGFKHGAFWTVAIFEKNLPRLAIDAGSQVTALAAEKNPSVEKIAEP